MYYVVLVILTTACLYSAQALRSREEPVFDQESVSEVSSIVGCALPKYPRQGSYTVSNYDKEIEPGDIVVPYTLLEYSCKKLWILTNRIAFCQDNGTWSSSPECIRPALRMGHFLMEPHYSDSESIVGCALPNYPRQGSYAVFNYGKEIVPGDIVVPYTLLEYSCETSWNLTNRIAFCQDNGTWSSSPECNNACQMPTSHSEVFLCFNRETRVLCAPSLPGGISVRSVCRPGYLPSPGRPFGIIKCLRNGKWNKPFPKCQPVCGIETGLSISHIVNGTSAKTDSFPWHVAVFQDVNGRMEYICGGSLLESHIVVSAAHCFYDVANRRPVAAQNYKITAGNFYRTWDHEMERGLASIQKSEVKEIILHDRYGGAEQNHENDIALLVLTTPFNFSGSVRPICYDLSDELFDTLQLEAGKLGKVAGWGLTETGRLSEKLRTLSLPVVRYSDCIQEVSKYEFRRFITADKICAGYLNGSALCQGDSGGGLVFPAEQPNREICWYLRGIVSNGPQNRDTYMCQYNTYTAFTRIFTLRDWLNSQLWNLV